MDLKLIDAIAANCDVHARHCRQCGHKIIDDEGNPGLFSEACKSGLPLLIAYCRALGESIPRAYEVLL